MPIWIWGLVLRDELFNDVGDGGIAQYGGIGQSLSQFLLLTSIFLNNSDAV